MLWHSRTIVLIFIAHPLGTFRWHGRDVRRKGERSRIIIDLGLLEDTVAVIERVGTRFRVQGPQSLEGRTRVLI